MRHRGYCFACIAFLLLSDCGAPRDGSRVPPRINRGLFALNVLTASFKEDSARDLPIGWPKFRPDAVLSVEVPDLRPGDILLVTAAYTVVNKIEGTNIGLATSIHLADHSGGFKNGDREILILGSPNIVQWKPAFQHYATPTLTAAYLVAPGDEKLHFINLVTWIGTDDPKAKGRSNVLQRARLDVMHFSQVGHR
jgi:hypothetical protein